MNKDFDNWNEHKKKTHYEGENKFYHPRDIWWCSLGVNVGFEQDGTGKNYDRPVVVIKGFNKHVFFGVALTGKRREGKYYFPIGKVDGREATAVLSQVRLFDTKRLVRKVGVLDQETFEKLKASLHNILLK